MNIYQATQIPKIDSQGVYRNVQLESLSWVFDCPDCEYIMTALTKEQAEVLEHRHMASMPDSHIESLREALWQESGLSLATSKGVI